MEIPSSKWLTEWEMEDSAFFPQYQEDYSSFDDNLNFDSVSVSPNESYSTFSNINSDINTPQNMISAPIEQQFPEEEDIKIRPAKQLKTNNNFSNNSCNKQITPKPSPSVSSSQIISFGNSNHSSPAICQPYIDGDHLDYSMSYNQNKGTKRPVGSLTRSPLHAQDHVIAERMRREKISQLYIALSASIPNLKKTDKASVLATAATYVKQIQERIKVLEEQSAKKTVESAVLVRKTKIYSTEDDSSSDENFNCQANNSSLPEIEARVSEKDVLITIHCEKNKGILAKITNEIEKINLSVVSSNVMPFGCNTLHITIAAEVKNDDFSISAKDIVKNLKLALQRSN